MSSQVLVVGSGAIGLRTALELLRRKVNVFLRSAHQPSHPSTCSMGAGGLWMPYKCEDPRVSEKWGTETLHELLQQATKACADSAVEIVPTLFLLKSQNDSTENASDFENPLPKWAQISKLSFEQLTVEALSSRNETMKLRIPSETELVNAGYTHGWLFHPPIVDAPRMLTKMMSEIQMHPLTKEINLDRNYESIEEMVQDAQNLGCDAVINCTGLGASPLCGDELMVGGRGVLLHYDRYCERRTDRYRTTEMLNDAAILTEDGKWGTETEPCYIIPRGNVYVVGGSYNEGSKSQHLSCEERKRLTKNASIFGIDTEKATVVGEWIGFRPCRTKVRMGIDKDIGTSKGVKVIHNYGHGGSGWTTFIGVAKEAVDLYFS